jgi:hypothetical protein
MLVGTFDHLFSWWLQHYPHLLIGIQISCLFFSLCKHIITVSLLAVCSISLVLSTCQVSFNKACYVHGNIDWLFSGAFVSYSKVMFSAAYYPNVFIVLHTHYLPSWTFLNCLNSHKSNTVL